ncbi:MAG TPA: calcium/sodium antiporter, partial [Bacteroidales bacterium]|nr:calcium/sodium antiporter [Bacteroidales bacterium]
LFIIGFVILIGGATLLIEGAATIGKKLGMPAGITGLTIVAIGTSLPELIINVFASIGGNSDLAISNVLGSNIINIYIILGFTALIRPIPVLRHTYVRDIPFSLLATVMLFVIVSDNWFPGRSENMVGRTDGVLLLLLIAVFLYIYYRSSKNSPAEESAIKDRPVWIAVGLVLAGIVGLYFGGEWIVGGAVNIAGKIGMDEATIGLTIIAMGTSLPELVTSIIASARGNPEMAIGNAVGSCIFNILMVLGVSAMINPLPFHPSSMIDLIVAMTAIISMVVFVYTGRGRKISRYEGFLMIMMYGAYLWFILS